MSSRSVAVSSPEQQSSSQVTVSTVTRFFGFFRFFRHFSHFSSTAQHSCASWGAVPYYCAELGAVPLLLCHAQGLCPYAVPC